MSRTPISPTLAALAAILAGVAAVPARAQDDAVRERVERLEADLQHPLDHKKHEAIQKLGFMGPDAASALTQIVALLERSDKVATRVHAARAAARIDPASAKVCSLLEGLLQDRKSHYKLREAAAQGLGDMAAATPSLVSRIEPVLAAELRSGQHGNLVDVALADALGRLGEKASGSAPAIEYALTRSPFGDVQIMTFIALARVSKSENGVDVAELVRRLEDPNLGRRATAFGQLRSRGERSAEAVEALVAIAGSERPVYERVAALDCLAAIAPADPRSIDAFVAALSTEDRWLKNAGGLGLGQLRPGLPADSMDAVMAHLDTRSDAVRRKVVEALHRVAPRDPKAIAKLVDLLGRTNASSDVLYVYAILEALRGAGAAAGDATGRLVRMLDRSEGLYRERNPVETDELVGHALVALAEIGMPASAAPAVLAELERDNKFTLAPAIRAAGALGARGAPAVPRLIAVLEDGRRGQMPLPFLHDAYPTLEAIRALGRMGPAARAAIPALTKIAEKGTRDSSDLEMLEVQAARRALEEIQG